MRLEEIPMVCISLDRRPERWTAFQKHAVAAGINVQRHSAVDAKTFVAHEHPAISLGTAHNIFFKTRRGHYEIDAAGAVGCSLSHVAVWKEFQQSRASALIVFEDDAVVPLDVKERLEQIVAELPEEWDLIQFQQTKFATGTDCKPISPGSKWERCTSLMGSFAYMVNQRGVEKLLARFFPIEMHIDAYMAYMSRMNHIRMLWHPLLDIPFPAGDSDIDHGYTGIVQIPTNMKKHGVVAMKMQSVLGLAFMAAVVGGILTLAYAARPRR
jgi:GR25 family glycosyltransferase involved in LPS biosynthesis